MKVYINRNCVSVAKPSGNQLNTGFTNHIRISIVANRLEASIISLVKSQSQSCSAMFCLLKLDYSITTSLFIQYNRYFSFNMKKIKR